MSSKTLPLTYLPLAWAAVLFTSLTCAILGCAGLSLNTLADALGLSTAWEASLLIYMVHQFLVVVTLLHLLRRDSVKMVRLGFKASKGLKYYLIALAFVPVASLIYSLCNAIVSVFGLTMWWSGKPPVAIRSPADLAVLSACAVIAAPLLEETMYRGYVLNVLLGRFGLWKAFLLDALIFASIHYALGPGIMLFILLWTFIPCILYVKSQSLYPPMVFHAANNLLAYVVVPLTLKG